MNDIEIRIECLRLALSMRTDAYVGNYAGQLGGMMAQAPSGPTAQQIRDRAKVFYDFARNITEEPAPTPVKIGDKLVVVGG